MSRALIVMATDEDRQKAVRWVGKAPWNTRIEFKAPKRSLPQNDRMWAMLTDVMMHMRQHGRDYTTDQWKAIFMHACGKEVSFLPSLDGKTFIPWGQSSSDLGKNEMTDLIEFMFAWGAENGVKFNEPADVSSVSGEGSDGPQPSPDAQTVAAAPSEPVGGPAPADEIEAREEPSASSAGEPIDRIKRMLMEEAIDNMLRDAFSEPAIERPAKVDKLRDIFLEPQNLGDFPDFVNRCHETARRVIGKPAEKARAREYLFGRIPA